MEHNNLAIQSEKDFRFISENIDIWPSDGSFPFKTGDIFPPKKLIDRANISYTNRLLYNNEYGDVLHGILSVVPETDVVYAQRIKDIIADLPFFKIVVDAFNSICLSKTPLFDSPDNLDQMVSDLIERSNIRETLESIIKSIFLDTVDAYRVTTDLNGNPCFEQIPAKNLIIYNHPSHLSSIYCTLVSNVLSKTVEFIEYWYDGKIVKRVYEYANGKLGQELSCEESVAFGGKFKKSPIVIVKHNTSNINDTYGKDQFSTWDGSVVALCRTFSNLLRLNERVRESIRVVPESALSVLNGGQVGYLNRGVITYADGLDSNQRPDIEYIIPDIKSNVDACKETMERCIKMISMSTGLAPSWFDPEKTGTNLSGNSLKVSMIPTVLKCQMIVQSIDNSVRELICKMANANNIDLKVNQLDITWFADLNVTDEKEVAEVINTRLENGTISKEDAIIKMDRVSRRIAKERANKLSGVQSNPVENTGVKPIESSGLEVTAERENVDSNNIVIEPNDVKTGASHLVPDYQMPLTTSNMGV